jgi:hypothetical protein
MMATVTTLQKLFIFLLISILSISIAAINSAEAADVTLAWDANGEANLAGYLIYYTANSPDGWICDQGESPIIIATNQLTNPNKPTFKLTGLTKDTFFFSITALNHVGEESDFSDMVAYTPPLATYTLLAVSNEFGVLSQEGEVDAIEGTTQTFVVMPNPFCRVVDVILDGNSLGAVSTVTLDHIDRDHEILAIFEKNEYTITLSSTEFGNISLEGLLAVPHGSSQTFSFTAESNCNVIDILVDGASIGPRETLILHNITGSHTIEALFGKDSVTITSIAGENGNIEPGGGPSFEYGSSQTFAITANENYEVLDVLIDGVSIGAISEYTFENITGPHAIEAIFIQTATDFMFEANEIFVNQNWKHVTYQKTYANPVVVVGSHSLNDDAPAVVRIQNVTKNGFDICIQEWDYLDDMHAFERVGYVAMEAGTHLLPGGTQVKAGTVNTNTKGAFEGHSFDTPFNSTPVVIANATTFNDADAITIRMRYIDHQGFQFMCQEQQLNSPTHASETVSFIAWEPSQGNLDGTTFEVSTTSSNVSHNNYLLSFKRVFSSRPSFISSMQTCNGRDIVSIRWQNKTEDDLIVKLVEEQSLDEEIYHAGESVGYMLFLP